jgi:hypothetical protein
VGRVVQTGSALAALTVLKKICDHPKLLTEATANEIAEGNWADDWGDVQQHLEQPDAVDAEASCKIVFLLALLEVRLPCLWVASTVRVELTHTTHANASRQALGS